MFKILRQIVLIFSVAVLPTVLVAQDVTTMNDYRPHRGRHFGDYASTPEPHYWQPATTTDYDSNNAAVNRARPENKFGHRMFPDAPIAEELAEDGDLSLKVPKGFLPGADFLQTPGGLVSTLQIMVILTVITLSPSILIMTTSFVRIMVVLAILRQAVGTQQLPPSQVITALALFLTFLIMFPVWSEVYTDAVLPFSERRIGLEPAFEKGQLPIRRFMAEQITRCNNTDDVLAFLKYIPDYKAPENLTWRNVPWRALLPAFMLNELKTAFMIGFQIYLPFLVLDMVVASVMVSMGMMMLPPVIISLPFKLMLFVLVDGWNLVCHMIIQGFEQYIPSDMLQSTMAMITPVTSSGFC